MWACSGEESPSPDPEQTVPLKQGSARGTVKDSNGQPYQGIAVNVKESGQVIKSGTTSGAGNYQINQIPVGDHQINFKTPLGSVAVGDNQVAITISDGETATQDFTFDIRDKSASLVHDDTDPLGEVRNAQGQVPTSNSELLFTPLVFEEPLGQLYPIMAPDGHHVTFGEWRQARGTATVTCDGSMTRYELHFTNLIPNGVYTIWNFILNKNLKPTDPFNMSADVSGAGALKDGSSNILIASISGEAQLSLDVNPGSLSMFGSQPSCAISTAAGFVLVINYHIDGQTHGNTPGPDKDDVAHMLVYY